VTENVCKIVNYSPKFFEENACVNYQKYMIESDLTAVPIVDQQMKIIRIERLKSRKEPVRKIGDDVPVVIMAGGNAIKALYGNYPKAADSYWFKDDIRAYI
jgi:hypothetical protein